jgi:hypothetical protein
VSRKGVGEEVQSKRPSEEGGLIGLGVSFYRTSVYSIPSRDV